MPSAVAEAKSCLTIRDIGAKLFPDWKPGKSCRCPWREDIHNSFSVSDDGGLFNDFAEGAGGDQVSFLARARGIPESEAAKELIRWAGVRAGGSNPPPAPVRPVEPAPERVKPELPPFDEGTADERRRLACLRNLSPDGIGLAVDRGLLRFCDSREGRAWVVTDRDRWAAQARRLDGKPWQRLTGQPKAWTLQGSRASWPIGFADAVRRDRIALVEGGPDALAALHHALASGCADAVGVIAMIGASCRLPAECLPSFAGLPVRVFIHADAAGMRAARKWAGQLAGAGARVSGFDFSGMFRTDGAAVGDLNDMASISPDSWEEHRELIENAMRF
jgi:hypothetical protein